MGKKSITDQLNKDRLSLFTRRLNVGPESIDYDFSKTHLGKDNIKKLKEALVKAGLREKIEEMWNGENVNYTENRPVLHYLLRHKDILDKFTDPSKKRDINTSKKEDSLKKTKDEIAAELRTISKFCSEFNSKTGITGKNFDTIVNIGIGGSDLGPRMVTEALEFYSDGKKVHFISNVDPSEAMRVFQKIDIERTLFIVVSKTFTTVETIENFKLCLSLFKDKLKALNYEENKSTDSNKEDNKGKHKGRCTSEERRFNNIKDNDKDTDLSTEELSMNKESRSSEKDGGSSVEERKFNSKNSTEGSKRSSPGSSSSKLNVELYLKNRAKKVNFTDKQICNRHFVAVSSNKEEVKKYGISKVFSMWDFVGGRYSLWSAVGLSIALYVGFENYLELLRGASVADEEFRIRKEESIAAQMAMNELFYIKKGYNNKCIVAYDSYLGLLYKYLQQAEMESNGKHGSKQMIIWGGLGTDVQHSFFQLLHQGEQQILTEFLIGSKKLHKSTTKGTEKLLSKHHMLLQANCLAQSRSLMVGKKSEDQNHNFEGDKPSVTVLYSKLTPATLGAILAVYEHKIFVTGVFYGINSFDQFGVQLGKEIAIEIFNKMQGQVSGLDSSTEYLITNMNKE